MSLPKKPKPPGQLAGAMQGAVQQGTGSGQTRPWGPTQANAMRDYAQRMQKRGRANAMQGYVQRTRDSAAMNSQSQQMDRAQGQASQQSRLAPQQGRALAAMTGMFAAGVAKKKRQSGIRRAVMQ